LVHHGTEFTFPAVIRNVLVLTAVVINSSISDVTLHSLLSAARRWGGIFYLIAGEKTAEK
jgi:multisubunit Na+/H+ antiporter MnhC subunit